MTVKLFNADCLTVLPTLPDKSVDVVLTDPPYNLGLFAKSRADHMACIRPNSFVKAGWDNAEPPQWLSLMDACFKQLNRVCRDRANVVVFMAFQRLEDIINVAQRYDFYYKCTGIWHKSNPLPRNKDLQFINAVEGWLHFVCRATTGTFNNNGIAQHNFYNCPVSSCRVKHPTQKPEQLIAHLLKLLSNSGDTVLDPFMGSGTTGVCAHRLGCNFIGIEINPQYYADAARRINSAAEQEVLFA